MAGGPKKISTGIFLMAIFVFLAVFLGGWLYRVYTTQTQSSDTIGRNAITCAGYIFGVDGQSVIYEDGVLYFDVIYKYGPNIDLLKVESGGKVYDVKTFGLVQGDIRQMSLQMDLKEDLQIYPTGCRQHNKVECHLTASDDWQCKG